MQTYCQTASRSGQLYSNLRSPVNPKLFFSRTSTPFRASWASFLLLFLLFPPPFLSSPPGFFFPFLHDNHRYPPSVCRVELSPAFPGRDIPPPPFTPSFPRAFSPAAPLAVDKSAMAAVSAPTPKLDRYIVIHVATTCDEHGVYVTKDSAEVIELGWILLDSKTCEEVHTISESRPHPPNGFHYVVFFYPRQESPIAHIKFRPK